MYNQRTFQGDDPRLGVPHSPGFTETTGGHNNCCQGARLWTKLDTVGRKITQTHKQSLLAQTKTMNVQKSSAFFFLCDPRLEDCDCEKQLSHFSYNRKLTSQSVSALSCSLSRTHTKVTSTLLNSSPDTDNMQVMMFQKTEAMTEDKHTHTCAYFNTCTHTHTHTMTAAYIPTALAH